MPGYSRSSCVTVCLVEVGTCWFTSEKKRHTSFSTQKLNCLATWRERQCEGGSAKASLNNNWGKLTMSQTQWRCTVYTLLLQKKNILAVKLHCRNKRRPRVSTAASQSVKRILWSKRASVIPFEVPSHPKWERGIGDKVAEPGATFWTLIDSLPCVKSEHGTEDQSATAPKLGSQIAGLDYRLIYFFDFKFSSVLCTLWILSVGIYL